MGASPAPQRNNRRGGRRGGGRRGRRQQQPAQPARVTVAGPTAGATPVSAGRRGRSGVVITYSDGTEEVRRRGSRAWRNNNPGNIRPMNGQIGSAGGFGVYRDEAAGSAAITNLLSTPAYQGLTIDGAVNRWAPPNENNTAAYQGIVQQQTGLPGNTPMSTLNAQQLQSVANAIRVVEGWTQGTVTYTRPRTP